MNVCISECSANTKRQITPFFGINQSKYLLVRATNFPGLMSSRYVLEHKYYRFSGSPQKVEEPLERTPAEANRLHAGKTLALQVVGQYLYKH